MPDDLFSWADAIPGPPGQQREHEEAPNHPRAWGAVWVRAVKDRVLEPTGTVRNTTDPRKHRHPCPIYRSLLSGLAR